MSRSQSERMPDHMPEVEYVLGHDPSELRRLALQAEIAQPVTQRLLLDAGLAPGMRVLDVGCGIGDVSMLAAAIVGPSGAVVGIDREALAIQAAEQRAAAAGLAVRYRQAAIEDCPDLGEFDFAIGRYVLIHQHDLIGFVQAVAGHVRPGGTIAFHEHLGLGDMVLFNRAPLWHRTYELCLAAFGTVMQHLDVGAKLVSLFHEAGLGRAAVSCTVPVGSGPDTLLVPWLALTMRSLLPVIERHGLMAAAELDVDTLEARLRDEAVSLHSQINYAPQCCGWARKPPA